MVQIIRAAQPKKTFASEIGAGLGRGLEKGIPEAADKFSEQIQQKRENEFLEREYGLKLKGVSNPQTRQSIIGSELPYARQMKQAKASHAAYDQQYPQSSQEEGTMPSQGGQIEGRTNVPQVEPRQVKGQSQATGGKNFPQEETQGVKVPIMTPEQTIQRGLEIARQNTARGVPMTAEQGIQMADAENARNEAYNLKVDQGNEKRIAAQEKYGALAEDKLLKLLPNATDEQKAMFRQFGENASSEGKSEANITRELAEKAKDFKNKIANIEKSVPAKRLFSGITNKLLGTDSTSIQNRNDMRVKIQPLLDIGHFDTARALLSDKGYYPEEREAIISDLGEGSKKALAELPKMNVKKKLPIGIREAPISTELPRLSDTQIDAFEKNISQALKTDPTANLILLRQAYEDKDVDWRTFKDAINNLVLNNQLDLTDEQHNQLVLLDTPPLNNLERILYKMGLMGR